MISDREVVLSEFYYDLHDKSILIVENEWLIADDLTRVLERQGAFVVGPAATAGQALSLLRTSPKIHAAVLDIHLGAGMDAYPVAEALRARRVPFLFATGYDAPRIRTDFARVPNLTKPFSPETMSTALLRIVFGHGMYA